MQPLFYDPFTRADGALDTTLYPSVFTAASAGIASNVVSFTAAKSGHQTGFDIAVPNYTVEGEFTVASGSNHGTFILLARYNNSTNAHYGFAWCVNAANYPVGTVAATGNPLTMSANTLYLVYYDGTNITSLTSASMTAPTTAQAYRMRISVNGQVIEGYVNDFQKVTTTHSSITTPNRAGFAATRSTAGIASAMAVTFDNFCINPFDVYPNIRCAYDQSADLIKWSMPSAGSIQSQKIYTFNRTTGDWTFEDVATTMLATWQSPTNERQILYGNGSDGKIYKFDDTATRGGSSFTGTWTSNWIKLDGTLKRMVVLEYVQYLVSLAEANQFEVSVEVADDPDDPTTYSGTGLIAGYDANSVLHIGQRGNFFRVSISHSGSTGSLKLRGIKVEALQ